MPSTPVLTGLPPFRGAVRAIVIVSAAIFAVLVLLSAYSKALVAIILALGQLSPEYVFRGWVWQFFTYGFLHLDPWNFFLTLLGIYLIGSSVESRIGPRAFVELYLSSLVGAGILGVALSLTGHFAQGVALGSGPAVNATLMVFYLLNRDASIYLFPIPIPFPVKWVVVVVAALEGAYLFLSGFSLFFTVQLLGLAAGYVWFKAAWRRSIPRMSGDIVGGLRNSYYRWKRDRAAKKFKVYMRKHAQDPRDHADEPGNFPPLDDKDKKNGEPGGWVN
jgi:membrane associated rhomboid family serine protease